MKEQLISFETAKLAKEKGFNILQHYVQGDKNPLFLNSQRHAPPTYSSDLPLLNKIFIKKFYDNQLLKSFLENTIENKDKRDEFFEYFKNNSNIDRTGSRDFDFLMYHFLENNQKINKDFSDFELSDFVAKIFGLLFERFFRHPFVLGLVGAIFFGLSRDAK